jgi:hypothetical protein
MLLVCASSCSTLRGCMRCLEVSVPSQSPGSRLVVCYVLRRCACLLCRFLYVLACMSCKQHPDPIMRCRSLARLGAAAAAAAGAEAHTALVHGSSRAPHSVAHSHSVARACRQPAGSCPYGYDWDVQGLACDMCPPGFTGTGCGFCTSDNACKVRTGHSARARDAHGCQRCLRVCMGCDQGQAHECKRRPALATARGFLCCPSAFRLQCAIQLTVANGSLLLSACVPA